MAFGKREKILNLFNYVFKALNSEMWPHCQQLNTQESKKKLRLNKEIVRKTKEWNARLPITMQLDYLTPCQLL